jgi:hypothetical protein
MVHTYFVILKVPGLPTRIRGNGSHHTGCHSAPQPPLQPPLMHISESNVPSIKLFEKLGFRITKWVEVFGELQLTPETCHMPPWSHIMNAYNILSIYSSSPMKLVNPS